MTPWQVLIVFVVPAVIACLIGVRKGYPVQGFFAGLVCSWLGVLALALWKPSHAELVRRERARLDAEREARQPGDSR
jgi:hypothetical protein